MAPNSRNIVITAGHSNTDPGAVSGSFTEARIVTEFRNLVADCLKRANAKFTTDGEGDTNLPLANAIKLISPGSVAVEFHCNAFSKPSATGVETLSRDQNTALGARLCAAVSKILGITNRGAKGESSGQHARLGFVSAGGLILELFFISNPDDLQAYLGKKLELAQAVADILIEAANQGR